MKKIVDRDVFLSYLNFIEECIIHIDASKKQLGGVIVQNWKPIAFYSCSKKLHLQSYLEMLWSETVYFGLLGNNLILFIILLYLIEG